MNTDKELNYFDDVNIKNLKFTDIFNFEEIQPILDSIFQATGVVTTISNPEGFAVNHHLDSCLLIDKISISKNGSAKRIQSHLLDGNTGITSSIKLTLSLCSGLLYETIKIQINGFNITSGLIGPVINEAYDLKKIIEYGDEIGANKDEFIEALKQLPVMSKDKFQKTVEMITLIANNLFEKGYFNLKQKNQAEEYKKKSSLWQEERLLFSYGNVTILKWKTNKFLEVNYVSPNVEFLLGYHAEEITSPDFRFMNSIYPEDIQRVKQEVETAISLKKDYYEHLPYRLIDKDGEIRWVSDFTRIIKDENENITSIVGYIVDISNRKKAEISLLESELFYRKLIENMNGFTYCEMILNNDEPEDFIYLLVNKSFEDQTGLKDVIGKKVSQVIPSIRESDPELFENIKRVVVTGKSEHFEIFLSSMQMWFSMFVFSPSKNHFVAIFDVITAQKSAEEFILHEHELFQEILNNQPAGIYRFKIQSVIKWNNESCINTEHPPYVIELTNNRLCEILGINRLDLKKRPGIITKLIYDKDKTDFILKCKKANLKLIPFKWEGRLLIEEKIKWVHIESQPNQLTTGEILWTGFIYDISDQKFAEEARQIVERQYRDIFDKNPAVKLVIDPESGDIINANQAASYFYGYSTVSLLKMNIDDINTLPKNRILQQMALAKKVYSTNFNFQHRLASGEIRDVEVYSGPVETEGKKILYSIIHDITDRKKAEEALSHQKRRLADIIRGTNAGCWEWDIVSGRTTFNVRWAEMIGYTLEEISPTCFDTWIKFIHPDDLKKSNELLEKHFKGETDFYTCEVRMKHKNGNWIWVYSSGKVCDWDENRKPTLVSGTHLDITERKCTEGKLKDSQEHLMKFSSHLQKVQEEERILLATQIHDELGQILVALKMDIGLLKQKALTGNVNSGSEELVTKLDHAYLIIGNSIKTTLKIMNDLRYEVLYLLGFIEACKLYSNEFQDKNKIKCQFTSAISTLNIDSRQSVILFRILQDAMNNVAKHSKATSVKINLYILAGKLIFEIKDNGIGFDTNINNYPESFGILNMKERTFLLKGEMNITSNPGNGTCIKVLIPY